MYTFFKTRLGASRCMGVTKIRVNGTSRASCDLCSTRQGGLASKREMTRETTERGKKQCQPLTKGERGVLGVPVNARITRSEQQQTKFNYGLRRRGKKNAPQERFGEAEGGGGGPFAVSFWPERNEKEVKKPDCRGQHNRDRARGVSCGKRGSVPRGGQPNVRR